MDVIFSLECDEIDGVNTKVLTLFPRVSLHDEECAAYRKLIFFIRSGCELIDYSTSRASHSPRIVS
jgi:hypothetical protein